MRYRVATSATILLTIALAFLLISVLTIPVTKSISLCTYNGYKFGVFGYCEEETGWCSSIGIGYSSDALDGPGFSLPSNARSAISKLLIVHVIAAGFTFVALVLVFLTHFHSFANSLGFLLFTLIWTLPTFLLSLLAFLVDIILFIPHLNWSGWCVLVSTVLISVEGTVLCCMRRTASSRKLMRDTIEHERNGYEFETIGYGNRLGDDLPAFAQPSGSKDSNDNGDDDKVPLTGYPTGYSVNAGTDGDSADNSFTFYDYGDASMRNDTGINSISNGPVNTRQQTGSFTGLLTNSRYQQLMENNAVTVGNQSSDAYGTNYGNMNSSNIVGAAAVTSSYSQSDEYSSDNMPRGMSNYTASTTTNVPKSADVAITNTRSTSPIDADTTGIIGNGVKTVSTGLASSAVPGNPPYPIFGITQPRDQINAGELRSESPLDRFINDSQSHSRQYDLGNRENDSTNNDDHIAGKDKNLKTTGIMENSVILTDPSSHVQYSQARRPSGPRPQPRSLQHRLHEHSESRSMPTSAGVAQSFVYQNSGSHDVSGNSFEPEISNAGHIDYVPVSPVTREDLPFSSDPMMQRSTPPPDYPASSVSSQFTSVSQRGINVKAIQSIRPNAAKHYSHRDLIQNIHATDSYAPVLATGPESGLVKPPTNPVDSSTLVLDNNPDFSIGVPAKRTGRRKMYY